MKLLRNLLIFNMKKVLLICALFSLHAGATMKTLQHSLKEFTFENQTEHAIDVVITILPNELQDNQTEKYTAENTELNFILRAKQNHQIKVSAEYIAVHAKNTLDHKYIETASPTIIFESSMGIIPSELWFRITTAENANECSGRQY